MRQMTGLLLLLPLAACSKPAEPPPPPPPPPPTYADFAGTWDALSTLEGTPDPVPSRLASTPQGGGWTMTLEGRDPVPMRVSLAGDSLVLISDPYESILRDNVQVQVRTASVLTAGGMEGKLIATYDSPDGQQVVMGTIRATRAAPVSESP
jgi:hypothetical protein